MHLRVRRVHVTPVRPNRSRPGPGERPGPVTRRDLHDDIKSYGFRALRVIDGSKSPLIKRLSDFVLQRAVVDDRTRIDARAHRYPCCCHYSTIQQVTQNVAGNDVGTRLVTNLSAA